MVAKLDADGLVEWTAQLGSSANDSGLDLAIGSAGSVFVTGYAPAGLYGNAFGGGSVDPFVVELDAMGERQWVHQLAWPSDEIGVGIAVTDGDALYLATRDTAPGDYASAIVQICP